MASVLEVSKLTAFSFAQPRLAVAHLSRRWITLLMFSPSTTHVTLSTKEIPVLSSTRCMNLSDMDGEKGRRGWRSLGKAAGFLSGLVALSVHTHDDAVT